LKITKNTLKKLIKEELIAIHEGGALGHFDFEREQETAAGSECEEYISAAFRVRELHDKMGGVYSFAKLNQAESDEWDNLIDVLSVYADKPEFIRACDDELISRAKEKGYALMKKD